PRRPVELVADRAAHHVARNLGGRAELGRRDAVAIEEALRAEVVVQVFQVEHPRSGAVLDAGAGGPAPTGLAETAGRAGAGDRAGHADRRIGDRHVDTAAREAARSI